MENFDFAKQFNPKQFQVEYQNGGRIYVNFLYGYISRFNPITPFDKGAKMIVVIAATGRVLKTIRRKKSRGMKKNDSQTVSSLI